MLPGSPGTCVPPGNRKKIEKDDHRGTLKTNRKGLRKLFNYVINKKVDIVLVTWRDRLTRFGFEYLEFFFKQFGVKIECIMHEEKTPLEELLEDFVSIVTSFAARIYGKRSKKVKQFVEHVKSFLRSDFPQLP